MNDFIILNKFGEDGKVAVSISDISCISDNRYFDKSYSKITLKNGVSCSVTDSTEVIIASINLARAWEEQ